MKKLPESWAEQGITYMSHSQLEKPACLRLFEYRYLQDRRKDIPSGIPAVAGGAAHDGIQSVVCDGIVIEDAIMTAVERVQSHEPIDELDALKTAEYVEDVATIIQHGVEALAGYDDTFVAEERISLHHPKLAQEIMGFVDLTGENSIVELKTKWNTFGPPRKDGTRGVRMAKVMDKPDPSHLRQVAIYWAATGKMPALIYITTQGAVTFNHENSDYMTVEALDYHFNQILHNAIVWENLLSISTDPQVLKYWIQPDWENFKWRFMPTEYLKLAKELWTS